ncbi:MAG: hypothetical protein ACYC61_27785, partial [Isosphaeraceae bacterium]
RQSLVATAIVALALGWLVNGARVQRQAIAAIERAGGKVWYAWEAEDDDQAEGSALPWPSWLVKALGVDYFGSVVGVRLSPRCDDETMESVGRLDRLESLDIVGAPITEKG